MKTFRTIVEPPDLAWKTGYKTKNVFMGSCFTENIGVRMKNLCFDADVNPFGIVYNPASVAQSLRRLTKEEPFVESDLVYRDGLWHSFMHHGDFSRTDKAETLDGINNQLKFSREYLKHADFLFITFGTAWVFQLKDNGLVVSNCHKFPASQFCRVRLNVREIVDFMHESLTELWQINTGIKVVFTVSPIRHFKDGATENQLSKSTLLLSVDDLIRGSGNEKYTYFPSYEIVMDDLRDYRFYAEDMMHISQTAMDYIWDKFKKAAIDEDSVKVAEKIKNICNDLDHKPLYANSKTYRDFLEKTLAKIEDISDNFPYINTSAVKDSVLKKIKVSRDEICINT
ncbi:MAG: GSCFA domain-containing protein [Prolixibacteraceae bacterium]|nr:GSCFA domain-containing protein [Prolixibacteraceae bacterium]